jgi:hypothetical protein
MDSTAQSNLAMSLKVELESVNKDYAQALRESQQGDQIAGARVIDLQAQILSIREGIKTADQASNIAEAKENDEKAKKDEEEYKRHVEEKLAQESKSNDSGYKFLDDVDKSTNQQALAASAQLPNSVTAQVAGKAQTTTSDEDKHETKAVSSSGQAST